LGSVPNGVERLEDFGTVEAESFGVFDVIAHRASPRIGLEQLDAANHRVSLNSKREECLERRAAYANFVRPGIATGGVASFMSHVSGLSGRSDSLEPIASSHVIVWPVYAAMRPMIATMVECAILWA
jgi:hypothetical protein